MSLHKYGSVYENNRLFRKPPLLGPPLSCAKLRLIQKVRISKSGASTQGDSCHLRGEFALGEGECTNLSCETGVSREK